MRVRQCLVQPFRLAHRLQLPLLRQQPGTRLPRRVRHRRNLQANPPSPHQCRRERLQRINYSLNQSARSSIVRGEYSRLVVRVLEKIPHVRSYRTNFVGISRISFQAKIGTGLAPLVSAPELSLAKRQQDGTKNPDNSIDHIGDGRPVTLSRRRMLQLSRHQRRKHSHRAGSAVRAARQQHHYHHDYAVRRWNRASAFNNYVQSVSRRKF